MHQAKKGCGPSLLPFCATVSSARMRSSSLTVNPKLSKELGSRHRAAIGLTEENDSVAIVVSEETGAISVVMGPWPAAARCRRRP